MNWLSRTELLLGTEALDRLKESRVLVVGLGGVGAYAAEMVCRAGVGNLTIVDGDTINETNINRQLPALTTTTGRYKTEVMAERLMAINPGLNLTVISEFIRDDRMKEVLEAGFDYVIDAIDTLSPKVFLIYHCVQMGIPVVSSMGAGGKVDPTQIRIDDISKSHSCRLARILRKRLHKLGVRSGVTAVYSPEEVDDESIVPAENEQNKASVVGTVSWMPPAFGCACASAVINNLTSKTV